MITLLLRLTFSSLPAEVKALLVPSFNPFLLHVLLNKKALASSFCITRFTKIENPCNGQSCNRHSCNIAMAFPNFLFIPMLNVKGWRPELKVINTLLTMVACRKTFHSFTLSCKNFVLRSGHCPPLPLTLLMPSRLQIPFHFDPDIVPLTLNVLYHIYFK